MRKLMIFGAMALGGVSLAQTDNPAVNSWLINTTGIQSRHYVNGNSTPIQDSDPANVQLVQYSNDYSYIHASGLPSYIIGPYLDGNPSQASDNEHLFQIPLNPVVESGTKTETPLGYIGVFINGVPMYDYKDGVSYSNSSGTEAGGPLGGTGDGVWNRDAIKAENEGFDCAKGHPSPIFDGPPGPGGTLVGGTYHHHQNPSAFNLDLVEISDICDTYLADGLYVIDSTQHSPLIGYAFDGFPVYGAYGYADPNDPNSGIKRIQSSYKLRNITVRTHYADGTDVIDGPAVNATYPLGHYREDYELDLNYGDLDENNGRFCKTPEYPNGIYCYFATVDENWNSAYPYLVGPTYYGDVNEDNFVSGGGGNNVSISESVEDYDPSAQIEQINLEFLKLGVYPNPANDFVVVQISEASQTNFNVKLSDMSGKELLSTSIPQGSTIAHFDTQRLYSGTYIVTIYNESQTISKQITISK